MLLKIILLHQLPSPTLRATITNISVLQRKPGNISACISLLQARSLLAIENQSDPRGDDSVIARGNQIASEIDT